MRMVNAGGTIPPEVECETAHPQLRSLTRQARGGDAQRAGTPLPLSHEKRRKEQNAGCSEMPAAALVFKYVSTLQSGR